MLTLCSVGLALLWYEKTEIIADYSGVRIAMMTENEYNF